MTLTGNLFHILMADDSMTPLASTMAKWLKDATK